MYASLLHLLHIGAEMIDEYHASASIIQMLYIPNDVLVNLNGLTGIRQKSLVCLSRLHSVCIMSMACFIDTMRRVNTENMSRRNAFSFFYLPATEKKLPH